eukprot:7809864-Prorocentrum_lima.AAC.1
MKRGTPSQTGKSSFPSQGPHHRMMLNLSGSRISGHSSAPLFPLNAQPDFAERGNSVMPCLLRSTRRDTYP